MFLELPYARGKGVADSSCNLSHRASVAVRTAVEIAAVSSSLEGEYRGLAVHPPLDIVAVSVTAFLMIASGLQSRLLERTRSGVCPACGRKRVRGVCDACSRRR